LCSLGVLINAVRNFYQMVAELRLDRPLHHANWGTEDHLVEFPDHLPRGELSQIPSFIHEVKYDHRTTRYVLRYFIAILHEDRSPRSDSRGFVALKGRAGKMLNEVSSIRWMTLNEARFDDDRSYHLYKTLKPFFNFAKKYVKNKINIAMDEPDPKLLSSA